jgi:hypothetical protein
LSTLDEAFLQIWTDQLEILFKRINIHLKSLDILLDQQAKMGVAGKGDVVLQNDIICERISIVKATQEIAELLYQAYGILVTSPNQLIEFLEEY